ncbi:T9SS type A sorting domain-containing protein [candidate division KSB1 bacterium]|nr:T9SS type A sorting domain-containing protein [candidate division KSB1 bacterium]
MNKQLKKMSIVIMLAWAVSLSAQQFGWESQISGTLNTLEAIDFVDANHGWAVGGNKGLLWQKLSSGITDYLYSIYVAGTDTAWAVGGSGKILKTIDRGEHWTLQTSGTTYTFEKVFFINHQTGWVAGSGGHIRKTVNGGEKWDAQTSGTYNTLYALFFVNENIGWAAGMSGTIIKTINGGAKWTAQTSGTTNTIHSLSFVNADTGWAVGSSGMVLKTTNGGETWLPQNSGITNELESVCFVDGKNGWAAGDRATIVKTTDGGNTWTVKTELVWPPYELHGITFADANTGVAVGTFGTILSTNDGGNNWIGQNSGTTEWLYDVALSNDHNGFVVGHQGVILKLASGTVVHTTDGGVTWLPQNPQTPNTLYGVDFVDMNTGWTVGGQGTIMHSTDGGQIWNRQISGTVKRLYDVCFLNNNTGWAIGESGTILRTADGGKNWLPQTSETTDTLYAVNFVDQNNGMIVGSKGLILKTANGGQLWEKNNIANYSLNDVKLRGANTGWVVGNHGTILKTADGGSTWIDQRTDNLESLYSINFIDSNTGWICGKNGVILKTTIGGDFWVKQNSGSPEHLYALTVIDAMTAWTTGEKGTVLKTSNATDNQPPTLQIEAPVAGQLITINDQPVTVSGTAKDENGAFVKLGFDYLPVLGNQFNHQLYLPNGEQLIKVMASDPAGNMSTAEVTVKVEMNLPTAEIKYYLFGSSNTQQLSLTPEYATVKSETYYGAWFQAFPTVLTGYLNGNEYKYKVKLASSGATTAFTLSWYIVENEGRRRQLATTSFGVDSRTYSDYDGIVMGPHSVAFPGQTLLFEVAASSPGGLIWGNGSSGSHTIIPGGLTLPPAAPDLVSPMNEAIDQERSLTVSWNPVIEASYYHLQVATDSLFTAIFYENANIAGTSRDLTNLLPSTTYYWRVRAQKEGIFGPWSDTWHFTTIIAAPIAPVLASPVNSALNQPVNLNLSWNASVGALSYHLQVSLFANFSTFTIDKEGITENIWPIKDLVNNTTYYWRVNATNSGGTSEWSTVWNFKTIVTRPEPVILNSPGNSVMILADTLTCSWQKSIPDVTGYWFEMATDSLLTNVVIDSNIAANHRSKKLQSLLNNQTYWWRVCAKNIAGWGPFSKKQYFMVNYTSNVTGGDKFPTEFSLCQNYPNPFNPSTIIEYTLPVPSQVELKVYDILGNEIQILMNGRQPAGRYRVQFDSGGLPAGIYYYTLRADNYKETRKMVVVH